MATRGTSSVLDRKAKHLAAAALAANTADAVAALAVSGLPLAAQSRMQAIIARAESLRTGVPISVAAELLDVSQPTVRAWIKRGALDVVTNAQPTQVTTRSLGEALAAVSTIRSFEGKERVLSRTLEYLEDTQTRRSLAHRVSQLDSRRELSEEQLDELFS